MLGGGEIEESKDSEKKVYSRKKSFKEAKSSKKEQQVMDHEMGSEELNLTKKSMNLSVDVGADNGSVVFEKKDVLVRLSLSMKSKNEARELRRKLEGERDRVQSLLRKIEANEAGVGPPRMSKPLNQLNVVSVTENSKGRGEHVVEKEKRTPKANKMYRNSDFLLAKDKIPHSESNKKMKSSGKKANVELGKFSTQVFKSCNSILERLMKHKHGWVFNNPVDAVALGLHDYFEVIKKPMDLGTVKNRLAQNWYNTPVEFAEDVRLTFQNAMTYNPKDQDVYLMAQQLSKIFEDKWGPVEADYKRELKGAIDAASPPPPMRKAPPKAKTRPDTKKVTELVVNSVTPKEKAVTVPQPGRVLVPKKPKARDPNKRDMTYDEKQKLSINLQSLPAEKLESVVHIIKKRNPSLTQQDDEIEVDIDSVDTETLWELDRFVMNFKKSLTKNKRKADVVTQSIPEPEQVNQEKIPSPIVTETPKESITDKVKTVSPSILVEEQGNTETNQGGAESSSSSESGSSSGGGSDGESSSRDGSDGGKSPKD